MVAVMQHWANAMGVPAPSRQNQMHRIGIYAYECTNFNFYLPVSIDYKYLLQATKPLSYFYSTVS